VIVFPNCKINLGLHVLQKRNDGYHDIETIFYPTPLQDALEILTIPSGEKNTITVTGNNNAIPLEDNICIKACRLLQNDFSQVPVLKIHLHKIIPSGAGLGGGSSDAAFTLMLLNRKFRLGLSNSELLKYALQLGSDCPFFILNQPCYATGRGELLDPVDIDLSSYSILLVNPGISISTSEAFGSLEPQKRNDSLREVIRKPVDQWKNSLVNVFEASIFKKYPGIKELKTELYRRGAKYASMTGSGSTVFGLFPKDTIPDLTFPSSYFVHYS